MSGATSLPNHTHMHDCKFALNKMAKLPLESEPTVITSSPSSPRVKMPTSPRKTAPIAITRDLRSSFELDNPDEDDVRVDGEHCVSPKVLGCPLVSLSFMLEFFPF